MKVFAIISSLLLLAGFCRGEFNNDGDFRKYGFVSSKNLLFKFGLWGYRTEYLKKSPNSFAYALGKIPFPKNDSAFEDKLTFRFKARLYPVAPDTEDLRRVIKGYVINSLGHIKEHKQKNGVICSPFFVLAMQETLGRGKESHCSFPIQYIKTSEDQPETRMNMKEKGRTIIFRDGRILPLNLFTNYDVEVCFDYGNKIVSFNCNGNKVILQHHLMKIWPYFGFATLFTPVGYKKHTVFALEYEFTNIKIDRNGPASVNEKTADDFPRFKCDFYRDIIKRKDDVDAMFCLGMNYYEGTGGALKDYFEAFKWFKKAAVKDHVFAQYYLGLCHLYGRGTKLDKLLAWKWLYRSAEYLYDKAEVMAAQCVIDKVKYTTGLNRAKLLQRFLGPAFFQGNANACYLQSYCAYYDVAGRNIKYIEGFRDAARRGHPKAFYYLGKEFAKSGRTLKVAFKCYQEAAKRGFSPGMLELGKCYFLGNGTGKDYEQAFKNFEKSADTGNREGIFYLGCCYLTGQGVKADRKQAVRLFNAAADKGCPRALIALLLLKEKQPSGASLSKFFYGDDGAADAENKGIQNSTAAVRRAVCLKYGIGTVKRPKSAFRLLEKLSGNDSRLNFELGGSCEQYRSESRNIYKALGVYKKAFQGGNLFAALRLGSLYLELSDKSNAELYFGYAAKKGNADAAYELGKLKLSSPALSSKARRKQAFKFFKTAADAGHIQAAYETGKCYYLGQGVSRNALRAAQYWKRYEDAFEKKQNNSIHGIYWKKLPYQRPLKCDANGLPLKYFSHLRDKDLILQYYKKY